MVHHCLLGDWAIGDRLWDSALAPEAITNTKKSYGTITIAFLSSLIRVILSQFAHQNIIRSVSFTH